MKYKKTPRKCFVCDLVSYDSEVYLGRDYCQKCIDVERGIKNRFIECVQNIESYSYTKGQYSIKDNLKQAECRKEVEKWEKELFKVVQAMLDLKKKNTMKKLKRGDMKCQ